MFSKLLWKTAMRPLFPDPEAKRVWSNWDVNGRKLLWSQMTRVNIHNHTYVYSPTHFRLFVSIYLLFIPVLVINFIWFLFVFEI